MAWPFSTATTDNDNDDDWETAEESDDQYSEHTGRKFCYDTTCPDKEDQDAISDLNDWYQNGLASREDVDNIYRGRTV